MYLLVLSQVPGKERFCAAPLGDGERTLPDRPMFLNTRLRRGSTAENGRCILGDLNELGGDDRVEPDQIPQEFCGFLVHTEWWGRRS